MRLSAVVVVLLAMGAYWATRGALGELEARALSIVVIAAGFWATEALPLFATAFVVVGLQIVLLAGQGGLADQLTLFLDRLGLDVTDVPPASPMTAGTFLAPLASDIIVLFLGSFLLAGAIAKHGVDRVMARRVLRPFTASSRRLLFAVLCITAFLSMWMSNTATTAMMLAVVGPIARRMPASDRARIGLLLAVPFGANIGGIGTPIGTPPNAIAYGVLNQAGYEITFLRWMLMAVPLELMLIGAIGLVLLTMFPAAEGIEIEEALGEPAPLTREGRLAIGVLAATVMLWLTGAYHGIQPGVVGLLAAGALSALNVLRKEDVDSIDWNILILMWGALTLSVAAEQSGLTRHLGGADLAGLPGGAWVFGAIVSVSAAGLSTIMSNTATAALLVPASLALAVPGNQELAVLAALACSFAMAMPVSTPPNAMAYATGDIPLGAMMRAGSLISIVALAVMLVGYRFVLPLVL